jgi:hypothetical protein
VISAASNLIRVVRLGLLLVNVPFGLLALYLGFYALAGLWDPDTPLILWALAAAQPLIALGAWLFSHSKWQAGHALSANWLLLATPASIVALIALLRLRPL